MAKITWDKEGALKLAEELLFRINRWRHASDEVLVSVKGDVIVSLKWKYAR